MTKIIELTELEVTKIDINYTEQVVVVRYDMKDANGVIYESDVAYFWVAMPPVPPGVEPPANYFILPPSYFPILLQLQTDADTALTNKFLV